MGIPVSNIKLIESHKAKIVNISEIEILNIPALFATTEVTLDDLNGTYFRKQITALTITPGYAWTITCGTTTYNIDETRKKFNELRPIFNNIFASFTIININNVHSEALNDSQIKQIENIAQSIASTSNANAKIIKESNSLNSFHATAKGRNVIFEYVLQTKNGLSHQELNETDYAIRKEVIPKICMNNVNNPTFDRGLNYTLIYKNTYNEKIAEFKIDKALCSKFNK